MDGLTKSVVLWRQPGIYDSPSSYPPGKCTNLKATANSSSVKLTWTDPEDVVVRGGSTTIRWGKTVIVRKYGSVPTSVNDGTAVTTSTVKNQYQETPYVDTITNGASYYYAAFACSTEGVYNRESVNVLPSTYKTMTVQFGITETPGYGTYLDDAVNMPYGKTSDAVSKWQEFFGYKPCLFKNGQVVGYLNPNDYTKFENGTSADITSGNAGDVMVEFPRRGIKISKSGSTVTLSMTSEPNKEGYSYNAHNRKSSEKNYFYIGAYLGGSDGNYPNEGSTSLSGAVRLVSLSLSSARRHCEIKGDGYMCVGFYQYLFIQCMYLLQYKGHLNSQVVHGYGFCNKSGDYSYDVPGLTDKYGMMYGTDNTGISTDKDRIKLFGIEDFWGNYSWIVDGCLIDRNYNVLIGSDEFNDSGTGYTNFGELCGNSDRNYMYIATDASCTSDTGFLPTSTSPGAFHSSTLNAYFCDAVYIKSNTMLTVGGASTMGNMDGIFLMGFQYSPTSSTSETVCNRIAYL